MCVFLTPTTRLSTSINASGGAAAAECDSICYLQAQPSAKSFSFATQRRQLLEQAEKAQAAQQASKQQHPTIKYDNINQFSQKVELYRGRCAAIMTPDARLSQ